MRNKLVWFQNFIVVIFLRFMFVRSETKKMNWTRIGSPYGGWWVPDVLIYSPVPIKVVSAGIGFDVSFDLEILRRGHWVVALDPIPECQNYAQNLLGKFEKFTLLKTGLGGETGFSDFVGPNRNGHTSWGLPTKYTNKELASSFPVVSLPDLILNLKLDQEITWILKLDIEGFEEEVIRQIPSLTGKPLVLLVEMDFLSKLPFRAAISRFKAVSRAVFLIKKLRFSGYRLAKTEEFNFCFIREVGFNAVSNG
jgi:FkbM family methyltransferase